MKEEASTCKASVPPPFILEAIPIPADQPIMQIRNLDDVIIPTMEIKVVLCSVL